MLKWLRNLMRPSVDVTVTNLTPDDLEISVERDSAGVRIIVSRRETAQMRLRREQRVRAIVHQEVALARRRK